MHEPFDANGYHLLVISSQFLPMENDEPVPFSISLLSNESDVNFNFPSL